MTFMDSHYVRHNIHFIKDILNITKLTLAFSQTLCKLARTVKFLTFMDSHDVKHNMQGL